MADLKQIKELNEEKRKSAKRKEFIMAELLETERSYVKVITVRGTININLKQIQQHWLMDFSNSLNDPARYYVQCTQHYVNRRPTRPHEYFHLIFILPSSGSRAGFVQVLRAYEKFLGPARSSERKRRSHIWKLTRNL